MYSSTLEIYHHDVHTGWFYNHLTKALPCSFSWRHHLLTTRDQESCSKTHFSKTGADPEFSHPFWLPNTKPNLEDWRGATPAASSLRRHLGWSWVLVHHAAAQPGHHAPPTRQVGLIATLPSCFEWCFSPSLFRCRDSLPWTGGDDLQAHYA